MRKYRVVIVSALLVLLGPSIATLGLSRPVPQGTFPMAVNARGEIAGYYVNSFLEARGFIRDARGRITVFDVPGAGSQQRPCTFASDINNRGTIVGYYIDAGRVHHGYVREPNGAFTALDAPGAGTGLQPPVMGHPELLSGQGTLATSVNDSGTITGYFIDAKNVRHGFLRERSGAFLTFDVPGSGGTFPESVNNSGEITGSYSDPPIITDNQRVHSYRSGAVHGFLRDATGNLTSFDVPSAAHAFGDGTHPQSVNDDGIVVGTYNNTQVGFIRDAQGVYTSFSAPESSIHPEGSSGAGKITACYLATKSAERSASSSQSSDAGASTPASPGPGRYRGDICQNIANGARLVGEYRDANGLNHGFIRGPNGALATFDPPADVHAIAITSVSPIVAGATHSITIKGRHFGNYPSSADANEGRVGFQGESIGRVCFDDATPGDSEHEALQVARWTDSEIVVKGFSWPAKGICPFHAGDSVTIAVWNAQTGSGPASFHLTVGTTSKDTGAGSAIMNAEIGHETNANPPQANSTSPKSGANVATVTVPAYQPWTFTEINLRAGDSFAVAAEGTIVTNLAGATASPDGTPPDCRVAGEVHVPFVAPELPCWSLLGRIGPNGAIFEVGSHANLVAGNSGQLYLGVNDNFFGDNSQTWTAHVTANSSSQVALATDCVNAGNAHGLIQIVSGIGTFAAMDDAHKSLTVAPGSLLQGAVTLRVINGGPGFAVAPLIQTPSWGDHETSWSSIGYVRPGESQFTAQVNLTAPVQPGVYHILFAFQLETDGESVASATNWARYNNIWNDGNDIADFNSSQIQQAQQTGCAINPWLMETGIQPAYVPADAITVDVAAR